MFKGSTATFSCFFYTSLIILKLQDFLLLLFSVLFCDDACKGEMHILSTGNYLEPQFASLALSLSCKTVLGVAILTDQLLNRPL